MRYGPFERRLLSTDPVRSRLPILNGLFSSADSHYATIDFARAGGPRLAITPTIKTDARKPYLTRPGSAARACTAAPTPLEVCPLLLANGGCPHFLSRKGYPITCLQSPSQRLHG